MATTAKGFVFSLDLAVSFTAMLLMALLLLMHLGIAGEKQEIEFRQMELNRTALFLADSIVKNSNPEKPALGSAAFDKERARVLANELDAGLLGEIQEMEKNGFFIASISLKEIGGSEKTVFSKPAGKNCTALDRIVSAQGRIAKMAVQLCEK
ncbi:MAG: hypothetical protein JW744_03065 [Candidatus Diapherotrites archaeon]|uniref:Uncharacterized protein n=1 Tax=Candidatus Iainarchaeum sp. TaxID=3101447 RepID=A0A938YXD3_9ARCH|nr:hypothetical protein [Candidatus Diapherotrites archaeon]